MEKQLYDDFQNELIFCTQEELDDLGKELFRYSKILSNVYYSYEYNNKYFDVRLTTLMTDDKEVMQIKSVNGNVNSVLNCNRGVKFCY